MKTFDQAMNSTLFSHMEKEAIKHKIEAAKYPESIKLAVIEEATVRKINRDIKKHG